MKSKKIGLTIFIALCGGLFPLSGNIDLSIRYYNKKIYHPGTEVDLQLSIKNNSHDIFNFRVADEKIFSIDLNVRTATGITVPYSNYYRRNFNSIRHSFYRSVTLMPGESYSFLINLNSFVDLSSPGIYYLDAIFYPSLHPNTDLFSLNGSGGEAVKANNRLTLSIIPSADKPEFMERIEEETGAILRAVDMPPDQVVSYIIQAQQEGQWKKYFLYMDIQSLLSQNETLNRQYRTGTEEQQLMMIEEHRETIVNDMERRSRELIPISYSILKTSYTETEGEVVALARFQFEDYIEVRRYSYYLKRENGIWMIHRIDPKRLGTEDIPSRF